MPRRTPAPTSAPAHPASAPTSAPAHPASAPAVRVVLVRSQPKSSQLQALLFLACSQPNVLLFVSGLLPKAVFLALACSQPKVPLLVNALLHKPVAEVDVVDVGSFVRKIC